MPPETHFLSPGLGANSAEGARFNVEERNAPFRRDTDLPGVVVHLDHRSTQVLDRTAWHRHEVLRLQGKKFKPKKQASK